MNSFQLNRTPAIHFGTGKIDILPAILRDRGRSILVITGSGSFRTNPAFGTLLDELQKGGHRLYTDKVEGEPSPADVDRIAGACRQDGIDIVISVGGGSVMDAGKAVSAMLPLEGSVRDYLEGVGTKSHPGVKKFFVAVPTTSGTGSEATANAVISETGENGFKRSLRHENLMPDVAIIDPALSVTCPPDITAASGMDAFTQLLESYLSQKSGALTQTLSLEGMSAINRYLPVAFARGGDMEARAHMAYAAMLSGITLANAGLGLVHGFASVIGGLYAIPHGVVCGRLMGPVNRRNVRQLQQDGQNAEALEKYAALGAMLCQESGRKRDWYAGYVADRIDELSSLLSLPRFGAYGLKATETRQIAALTGHKENPVRFSEAELEEILNECI